MSNDAICLGRRLLSSIEVFATICYATITVLTTCGVYQFPFKDEKERRKNARNMLVVIESDPPPKPHPLSPPHLHLLTGVKGGTGGGDMVFPPLLVGAVATLPPKLHNFFKMK